MGIPLFFIQYLLWHYTRAFRDIFVVWFNFVWFAVHFFSLPLLLRTLFMPVMKIADEYHRTGAEDIATTFVFNSVSRIIGSILRLILIVVALMVLLVLFVCLLAFLFGWVSLPLLAPYVFLKGIALLLS